MSSTEEARLIRSAVRCRYSHGYLGLIFFFSRRGRHTRFDCDWISDVCSSDLSALVQRPLLTRLPRRLGLSFLLAVSFRPRRRGESFHRRLTFHRARALLPRRRTSLGRKRLRAARMSLHADRSFNTSRRSWDVSEECHNACGRSYLDVAARSSLAASSWRLWAPGRS